MGGPARPADAKGVSAAQRKGRRQEAHIRACARGPGAVPGPCGREGRPGRGRRGTGKRAVDPAGDGPRVLGGVRRGKLRDRAAAEGPHGDPRAGSRRKGQQGRPGISPRRVQAAAAWRRPPDRGGPRSPRAARGISTTRWSGRATTPCAPRSRAARPGDGRRHGGGGDMKTEDFPFSGRVSARERCDPLRPRPFRRESGKLFRIGQIACSVSNEGNRDDPGANRRSADRPCRPCPCRPRLLPRGRAVLAGRPSLARRHLGGYAPRSRRCHGGLAGRPGSGFAQSGSLASAMTRSSPGAAQRPSS